MTTGYDEKVADLILIAFESACPNATAADVAEWSVRYPEYGDEIAEYAEIVRQCSAMTDEALDGTLSEEDVVRTKTSAQAFTQARRLKLEEILRDATRKRSELRTAPAPRKWGRDM